MWTGKEILYWGKTGGVSLDPVNGAGTIAGWMLARFAPGIHLLSVTRANTRAAVLVGADTAASVVFGGVAAASHADLDLLDTARRGEWPLADALHTPTHPLVVQRRRPA